MFLCAMFDVVENGRFAFLPAIFDVLSLVSCASSNHSCQVCRLGRDVSALNRCKLVSRKMRYKERIFAVLVLSCIDQFMNTNPLKGVLAQLILALLYWAKNFFVLS